MYFGNNRTKCTPISGWYFNGNQYVKWSSDHKNKYKIITEQSIFEPPANSKSSSVTDMQFAACVLIMVQGHAHSLDQSKQMFNVNKL